MLNSKEKTNGFAVTDFQQYLEQEFPSVYKRSNYTRELVENLIGYGIEHENEYKDQFCDFLADIIPEISFKEVAMFMDDKHLTEYWICEKQEMLKSLNKQSND